MAEQKRADEPREPTPPSAEPTQPNEGEGSRTAARHYDEATEEFIREGKVEPAARRAREAIEGPEGAELRRAEERGKHPGMDQHDLDIEEDDE
jgi:hypothetical protein